MADEHAPATAGGSFSGIFIPWPTEKQGEVFTHALWYNDKPIITWQLVSDANNKFPWDEGVSEEYKEYQPIPGYKEM